MINTLSKYILLLVLIHLFSCKKDELANIKAEGNIYDGGKIPLIMVDSVISTNSCFIKKFYISIDFSLIPDTVVITRVLAYKPDGSLTIVAFNSSGINPDMKSFGFLMSLSCTEPSVIKFIVGNQKGKESLPTEYIYYP